MDATMQDNPASTAPPLKIDSGLACPVMPAPFHNVAAPEQLTHEFAEDGRLFSRAEMLLAAKKLDLKAKFARSALSRLSHTPLPAIATDTDGRFFIIARLDDGKALIHDPQAQRLLERQFFAKHVYLERNRFASSRRGS